MKILNRTRIKVIERAEDTVYVAQAFHIAVYFFIPWFAWYSIRYDGSCLISDDAIDMNRANAETRIERYLERLEREKEQRRRVKVKKVKYQNYPQ